MVLVRFSASLSICLSLGGMMRAAEQGERATTNEEAERTEVDSWWIRGGGVAPRLDLSLAVVCGTAGCRYITLH